MKRILLFIGLIVMVWSCKPIEEKKMTVEQRQEIASNVKQNFQGIIELMKVENQENLNKLTNLWVESNDEAWVGNPALWLNMLKLVPTKEAIIEKMKYDTVNQYGTIFKIKNDYIAVLSPKNALYVVEGSFSVTKNDSLIVMDHPLTGSYVYVLRNEEWKMLHIHQSWEKMEKPEKTYKEKKEKAMKGR